MSKAKGKPQDSAEAASAFAAADKDGNRLLDQDELKQALKGKGNDMSDGEVAEAFKAMDTNGDGRVDLAEFEAFVGTREREERGPSKWVLTPDVEARLQQTFEEMDKDRNGVLDEGERGVARQTLTVLLMEFGMPAQVFDGLGGLTFALFRDRFIAEWEVTRKCQGLSSADIPRAVAKSLPGGSPDGPLEALEGMTDAQIREWVRGDLSSRMDELFIAQREKLKAKRALMDQSRATASADNAKYRTATFGDIKSFHEGLAGQIGLPHPRLTEGLEAEHCRRDDSKDSFSPGNYDTTTTPEQEYHVATDPAQGKKASTGARSVRSVAELKKNPIAIEAGLRDEEVLALLLYTGPMFVKYNAVLRGFPEDAVAGLKGNTYTTTIYLIVSGIIKLSRNMQIPTDRMVFRGLGGLELPEAFVRPDKHGVRGGVEFAMMSTTLDRSVALQYAGLTQPTIFEINVGAIDRGASLVWLSQYPAEEEILLPPRSYVEVVGLARFEVGPDGRMVRIVSLKVNANVTSSTIEEIEARRKDLFLSAADNTLFEIKSKLGIEVKAPETLAFLDRRPFERNRKLHVKLADSIVAEVEKWVKKYRELDPEWYNDEWQYAAAVRDLTRLEAAAMGKWQHWAAGAAAAEPLCGEPIEKVMRLSDGLMTRTLSTFLSKDPEGTEDSRQIALKMCKRRGAVIKSMDEVNDMGEPAFVSAASSGHVANLKVLLAAGADVNTNTDHGITAMHVASTLGHVDYVKELVDAGADINAVDNEGVGCAYLASLGGQIKVLKYLFEKGGKDILMVKTKEGKGLMTGAAAKGYLDVLKLLFEKCGKDMVLSVDDSERQSAAYNAAAKNRLDCLEFLWEVGGKDLFDIFNKTGRTPAVAAAQNGHVDSLKFMAGKLGKEYLMILTSAKTSTMYWAARTGQLETMKYLVEACGVDFMKSVSKHGESCAHIAAERGNLDCLKFILEKGGKEFLSLGYSKSGKPNITVLSLAQNPDVVHWLDEVVPELRKAKEEEL